MGDMAFEVGKGLQDLQGSVPARKHKLNRSNIEQEANEAMMDKRLAGHVEKFPMQVHKAGGLVRRVKTEDDLADALAKGWKADIRAVSSQEAAMPEKAHQMTVAQVKTQVKAAAGDGAKLAALLADEQAHGNRAAVVQIIMDAADAVGAPSKSAKPSAAKKAASAKRKK